MSNSTAYRVTSIDILRGLVMIIMALDHTRDFFHSTAMTADPLNMETSNTALYFTRWITHFCAPVFVFLSGLSAYLSSRSKTKSEASAFLIKRGLWLVIAEMTLVTFGLRFDPGFHFIIWQVIWSIGTSMIILGLLIRTSYAVILITGILLFFGHNIIDYVNLPKEGTAANLWGVFLSTSGTFLPLSGSRAIGVFYTILPWTGVMLMGYSIGKWFQKDFPPEKRKRLLLVTGASVTVLFIVLRFARGYGDPGGWDTKSIFSFLNTTKYPPSLQYCCMTLGPALLLMVVLENVRSRWSDIVSVYGKVPFFYYILHFYLIHSLTAIVFFATGHSTSEIVSADSPFFFRPANFGYDLWTVYGIWILVVAALYFPCRWFYRYKMTHKQWWLKYL